MNNIVQSIDEAQHNIIRLAGDVDKLRQLVITDNLKYLTRTERDRLFKSMLESMGAIEDTLKAVIKLAKPDRRARLRDDEHLSRLILILAEIGVKVSDYERAAEEQQLDPSKCTMEAGTGVEHVTLEETLNRATHIEP